MKLPEEDRAVLVVRVWIPDRPGALGLVASRIGSVGGDVVGIEIIDRGAGKAVDDLVVELPYGVTELLIREISEVDGVDVEDVREVTNARRDTRMNILDTAAMLVEAADRPGLVKAVVDRMGADVDADWTVVVSLATGALLATEGAHPAPKWLVAFVEGSRASAAVAPEDGPAPEDVAWAPLADGELALVVGREGVDFRPLERRQLNAVARLANARWRELGRNYVNEPETI